MTRKEFLHFGDKKWLGRNVGDTALSVDKHIQLRGTRGSPLVGTAKRELDIRDKILKIFQKTTMSCIACTLKSEDRYVREHYCKRYCIPERRYRLNFAQQEDLASAYLGRACPRDVQSGGTR